MIDHCQRDTGCVKRVSYSGSTPAFQADNVGSIPITRSRLGGVDTGHGLGFGVNEESKTEEHCPYSSGVEHFLGKEEVIGSIPIMGSRLGRLLPKAGAVSCKLF